MASITKQANGRKAIQIVCPDGKRRTIRLGKMHIETAKKVKTHIEAIAAAKWSGSSMAMEQAGWLNGISTTLRNRIAKVGLCTPRNDMTLGGWLQRYIDHADVKPATLYSLTRARDNLVEHFGADKLIHEITPRLAKEWRYWLATDGNQTSHKSKPTNGKQTDTSLAKSTVRRRTGRAKQFFAEAVRAGLIESNPFAELESGTGTNESRQQFIPASDIEKCIENAPDTDWRTIIALARYGGLRVPSELVRLRWDDVNLPAGVMTITSPKTEHHEGGAMRVCPILPDLRVHLQHAWDEAPVGEEFVVRRQSTVSLRRQFKRIIKRAGVMPWEKLFVNLRASRETELLAEYPAKDVTSWLGNSRAIAMKHYAMKRDSVLQRAVRDGIKSGAECGAAHTGIERHERTEEAPNVEITR